MTTGPLTMRASIILAVLLAIASSVTAASTILVPRYTPQTNGLFSDLFSENPAQIIHLPLALFRETNTTFDMKVYESVKGTVKESMIETFPLITFIFSSPNTNDPVYSFCEMGLPHELICTDKSVSRGPGPTNEVPLIRVNTVDRRKKELSADLDLLIGVAPMHDPQDIRYLRRSFRLVFRDGWKEDWGGGVRTS